MSAEQLRDRLNAKWVGIDPDYTKIVAPTAYIPVIYTAWGWNLWRDTIEVDAVGLIRVDGVLLLRRSALDETVLKRLPTFRRERNVQTRNQIQWQPFSPGEWKRLQVRYSKSQQKHHGQRLPQRLSFADAQAMQRGR